MVLISGDRSNIDYVKGASREKDQTYGGLEKHVGAAGTTYLWNMASIDMAASAGHGSTFSHPNTQSSRGDSTWAKFEQPTLNARHITYTENAHTHQSPRSRVFDEHHRAKISANTASPLDKK